MKQDRTLHIILYACTLNLLLDAPGGLLPRSEVDLGYMSSHGPEQNKLVSNQYHK